MCGTLALRLLTLFSLKQQWPFWYPGFFIYHSLSFLRHHPHPIVLWCSRPRTVRTLISPRKPGKLPTCSYDSLTANGTRPWVSRRGGTYVVKQAGDIADSSLCVPSMIYLRHKFVKKKDGSNISGPPYLCCRSSTCDVENIRCQGCNAAGGEDQMSLPAPLYLAPGALAPLPPSFGPAGIYQGFPFFFFLEGFLSLPLLVIRQKVNRNLSNGTQIFLFCFLTD